jgi:hypothetical protein
MSLDPAVPADDAADLVAASKSLECGEIRGVDTPGNRELARRLRACVNACAGIPTDDLERGIVQDMRRVIGDIVPLLQGQRDALQETLAAHRSRATTAVGT